MRLVRVLGILAVAMAVLAFMAACGGDDEEEAAPTTAPVPTTAPAATTAPTPAAVPTKRDYWVANAGETPKRGGVVRFSSIYAADTLDGHIMKGFGGWPLLLYEPAIQLSLINPSPTTQELRPRLATFWEVESPTSIRIDLREGVKFHDGSAFNAEAAKWSFDRIRTDERSVYKSSLVSVSSVEVIDNYTIRLTLGEANVAQLILLGGQGMYNLSKNHMDAIGEEAFAKDPSGTGQMKLTRWVPDDVIELEPFPDYWGIGADGKSLPYIDGWEERVITDSAVALAALQTNQLDIYGRPGLSAQDQPIAIDDPDVVNYEFPGGGNMWPLIGFNHRQGVFADVRLRKAAAYALDRESITKAVGGGIGRPHYFPIWTAGISGWDESLPHYTYDPEKAKALVCEVNTKCEVAVEINQISREPDNTMAIVIKEMWDEVGLKTTVNSLERLAWIDNQRTDVFEAAFWGGPGGLLDPDQTTRVIDPESASNWGNMNIPEVVDCYDLGRVETDSAKRHEIYKDCQRILYEEVPLVVSYFKPSTFAHRKEVKGYNIITVNATDFTWIWLDR